MQRRVALARALAVDPDLLVLDEAFVSLDEASASALRGSVFGAVAARKATVLMVTHNIDEALIFSDSILVLAPRPTRLIEKIDYGTPREARSAAWLEIERARLTRVERPDVVLTDCRSVPPIFSGSDASPQHEIICCEVSPHPKNSEFGGG